MTNKTGFSQRHPFLFGFFLIMLAVAIIIIAMAFFTFKDKPLFLFRKGTQIGLVKVQGTISSSRKINDWIESLQENKKIKGVIVRVESPGGMVAPSQEIYQAVKRLAKEKPVVVSMGSVAASGGYYVACPAQEIVANPGTLTGSIGVKANFTNLQSLMEKIGIKNQIITSGKYKDAGSPSKPLTEEEKAYFQSLVDNLHQQFVSAVAQGRGMEIKAVEQIADGRAYTGKQAKDLGLVDTLGGFHTAINKLKTLAHIKGEVYLLEGPEKKRSFLDLILDWLHLSLPKQQPAVTWGFKY